MARYLPLAKDGFWPGAVPNRSSYGSVRLRPVLEIPTTPLIGFRGLDLCNLGGRKAILAQLRNCRRPLMLKEQIAKSLGPFGQFFAAVTVGSEGKTTPPVRIASCVSLRSDVRGEQLDCALLKSWMGQR